MATDTASNSGRLDRSSRVASTTRIGLGRHAVEPRQELQQDRVGGMCVVDHEDQRSIAGEREDQRPRHRTLLVHSAAAQRRVGEVPGDRIDQPEHLGQPSQADEIGLAVRADELGHSDLQLCERHLDVDDVLEPEHRSEGISQRLPRVTRPVGPAAPPENTCRPPPNDSTVHLGCETCLAHAGLGHHLDEVDLAAECALVGEVEQHRELVVAGHDPGRKPHLRWPSGGVPPTRGRIGHHIISLATEAIGLPRLESNRSDRGIARSLTDEDLARLGGLDEAVSGVHGVAGDRRCTARAHPPDQDLAGVDPDPEHEFGSE